MRAVSLFSGVGGFEQGLQRAGIETVLQVENDPWCLSVLARHWPEVQRIDDIRKVDASTFQGRCRDVVSVGDGSDAERLGAARGWRDYANGAGDGRADGADREGQRRGVADEGRSRSDDAQHRRQPTRPGLPGDIDLVYGGFPCFTAGTLVLTEDGYRPIEDLVVGDRVLSHTGCWRAVTSVMQRRADNTVILRGHGVLDVQTTNEHPFWSRQSGRRFIRRRAEGVHRSERTWNQPEWTDAASMAGRHASQVLPIESADPAADAGFATELDRRGLSVRRDGTAQKWRDGRDESADSSDFYWLVGRYLADGWVTPSNGKLRVVICAAYREADEVEERIRRCFPCTRDESRTAVKFAITRIGFARWLQQFGHRAFGKRIPGWVYSLSQPDADALLTGYLTGDGYYNPKRGWQFTSVSKPLALGVALLAQRARGVIASIGAYVPAERGDIEGRPVRQRPQYSVVIPDRHRSGLVEGNYGWKLIRSVRPAPGGEVFNISVEADESYVADGCVVHNCQDVSVAGQRRGLSGDRSGLWHEFHRVLSELRPRWCLIENVPGLLSSGSEPGADFGVVLRGLVDLGYGVAWRVLDARWFGVPQRRRRVFVVGCLGDSARAARVLAVCESCGGHPQTRREEGQDVAFTLAGGSPDTSRRIGNAWNMTFIPEEVAYTLPASVRGTGDGHGNAWNSNYVAGSQIDEGAARPRDQRASGYRMDMESETFVVASPVRASDGHHGYSSGRGDGADNLIAAFTENFEAHRETTVSPSLNTAGNQPQKNSETLNLLSASGVRRLTPREAERLQGWADDWTRYTADGKEIPDSHRYRCIGNGVVAPVAEWIGHRLVEADRWP